MKILARCIFMVLRSMEPPYLKLLAWCARYMLANLPELAASRPPIEPAADINRAVCLMASQDRIQELNTDPQGAQARLNACLQCVTAEGIQQPMLAMFGHLIAAGQHPEAGLAQVMANILDLGMHLERRLQSANAESPQLTLEIPEERQHKSETLVGTN